MQQPMFGPMSYGIFFFFFLGGGGCSKTGLIFVIACDYAVGTLINDDNCMSTYKTNVVTHLLLSTILSLIFYIGAAEGMIEYPGPVVIQETKMLGNTGVDVCREGTCLSLSLPLSLCRVFVRGILG